ncbi:MAG: FadR family transcriptional regulator [Rhodobacteraceae bacterium]|nr:FadR family transcriptional regulator [Paracoccaceae bacterium]
MMTVNATDIATALKQQISSGRFAVRDRLPPERVLAEQYGVARGTIRQALRQLEESRFVERRPGSGTYVTWSDGDDTRPISEITRPLDLVDARFAVEPQMCRLAVLHATGAELEKLRGLLGRMEDCEDDSAAFADIDEDFHLAIAEATANPMIEWMMRKIHETRSHAQWARMRELTLNPDVIRIYNRQHRAVVDAIEHRNPEAAAEAMKKHLSTARQTLVGLAD